MGSSQSSTNQEEGTENDGDLSTGQKAFAVGAFAGLAALEVLVSDSTSTSESFGSRSAKQLGSSQSSTNQKNGTDHEKDGALSSADEKACAVGAIAGLAALEIAKLVSGSTSTSESFRSRSAKKKGSCQSSTNYQVKGTASDCDLSMDQKAAVTAGAISGLSAWRVAKLVSGSSISTSTSTSTSGGQKKTMKAPGRNERIDMDDFERDPAAYFKSLRN